MKDLDSSTVERLRPLVGSDGWDYCIVWKLAEDQRCFEWVGCCCGSAEKTTTSQNCGGGEEQLFPVVSSPPMAVVPCRDVIFPHHPTARSCDDLAEFTSSIPLEPCSNSGIHAQVLMSGQPRWIYLSKMLDSTSSGEETRTTRLLVPLPDGLVELFVASHVPEDQNITNFVLLQCCSINSTTDPCEPEEGMLVRDSMDHGPTFLNYQTHHGLDGCESNVNEPLQPWIMPPPVSSSDRPNFPWDLPSEPSIIRLGASSLNLFGGAKSDSNGFFEGSGDSIHCEKPTLPPPFDSTIEDELHGMAAYHQHPVMIGAGDEKDSVKQEGEGRADSGLEGSDQAEDEEEQKMGRTGKRLSSKNLVAERKRRKKLNDRLYSLRALVPKISKMDRASILGDAIEFVKDLQKQVKELQDELEGTITGDDVAAARMIGNVDHNNNNENYNNGQLDHMLINHSQISPDAEELDGFPKGTGCSTVTKTAANTPKQNCNSSSNEEKGQQQMEPQVEVSQVDANAFFLKVLCEHKQGVFVRLLEAMNSMGLEVTNVNVTTFRSLVLNVFKVEKRDNAVIQADQVRDSLLSLTINAINEGGWSEMGMGVENGGDAGFHRQHTHGGNHHHHHHLNSFQHPHHFHFLNHQP